MSVSNISSSALAPIVFSDPGLAAAPSPLIDREALRESIRACYAAIPPDAEDLGARLSVEEQFPDAELDRVLEMAQEVDLHDPDFQHRRIDRKTYDPMPCCSLLTGLGSDGQPTVYLLLTRKRTQRHPRIGKGGFAEAKFAINLRTGKQAVVKVCKFSKFGPENQQKPREISRNEARTLQELKEIPGVVQFYSSLETEEKFYMLLEYCEGGDLYEKFVQPLSNLSSFSLEQRMRLALDIAEALGTLHEKEWTHRDLKPENILLTLDETTGEWRAKIADFGCFKKERWGPVNLEGTAETWSPEKCSALILHEKTKRPQRVDHQQDDTWAFGLILHALFHPEYGQLALLEKRPENRQEFVVSLAQFAGCRISHQIMDPTVRDILKTIFGPNAKKILTMSSIAHRLSNAYERMKEEIASRVVDS